MKCCCLRNEMLLSKNAMLLIEKINNSKTTQNSHFFKAIFRRKQDIKQDIKQVYILHLLSFFLFASFSFFDDDEAENK